MKGKEVDAFVFGTPVYYAHPSGRVLSFLDRAFYREGLQTMRNAARNLVWMLIYPLKTLPALTKGAKGTYRLVPDIDKERDGVGAKCRRSR